MGSKGLYDKGYYYNNDGKSSKNVQVTIDANLSTDKDSLAQIFRNILGEDSLFDIHIQYTMYKEPL